MNYDEARQRQLANGEPLGLWDWTTMNDGRVRRMAPCSDDCQHVSEEEACRHFYDDCLSRAQVHSHPNVQLKCTLCGTWTDKDFGNTQLWLTLSPIPLCAEHLNREGLMAALPFTGSIVIIHS